ncbi:unnamed protein product [Didymodactylos carnosus]|uniref:Uncharacterized protein n=1 Tax=Didymodactylos carnosus TaxID=1234261 RepID=A0A814IEP0_9BILA|nr:unnamed protein product [Didymodactylos carnosus]CAF1022300.1 unnamed protein product [Didymodactylos carnosus]CAF3511325.1 unnamed protein product [Didymodactylos carnosus]CAF3793647.1 unnamed protein product [Didymodactylos carnosus]
MFLIVTSNCASKKPPHRYSYLIKSDSSVQIQSPISQLNNKAALTKRSLLPRKHQTHQSKPRKRRHTQTEHRNRYQYRKLMN